jgi:hypothetical protein
MLQVANLLSSIRRIWGLSKMSGLDPFGNGQKFLTSFLHVALALLQYNNVTLGLLLPNQQGSWVRLQSLTQDAILVYRVLTIKACTRALCPSRVATPTSTNSWVRLQTNGIPVQALHIPLLYVNSFHFWSFMLVHPTGGGQRTKRVTREVPELLRLFLAREVPTIFLVREVPEIWQ